MLELLISNQRTCQSRSTTLGATKALTVPPRASDEARVGKCYNNVQATKCQRGGEAIYGWAVTDFGPHRAFGGGAGCDQRLEPRQVVGRHSGSLRRTDHPARRP